MEREELLEEILGDLESTAHWRREVLTSYPDDLRNLEAAELLEHLATEIKESPNEDTISELLEYENDLRRYMEKDKNYDCSRFVEECNEYRRRIGFSEFPNNGEAYLQRLLNVYVNNSPSFEYDVPKNPYSIFLDSYHNSGDILANFGSESGDHLINRMVFVQQIAALEAYLCDTLINAVMDDKSAMEQLLTGVADISKEKFALPEIAADPDFVKTRVRTYLRSILYHNLMKVAVMYKAALGITLFDASEDRTTLYTAVGYRHDCVHRNGIDRNGNKLEFKRGYVRDIADNIKALVEKIQVQEVLRKMSLL